MKNEINKKKISNNKNQYKEYIFNNPHHKIYN